MERQEKPSVIDRLNLLWKVPLAFIFSASEAADEPRSPKPPRYSRDEAAEILEAEMLGDAQISSDEHARLKRIARWR
jgi:hypothetical protein